ncbi:MAG: TolC family protein, partial [Alphaproteobacteria bacterium]|nr:TolC family protein [Alphaproteobacteria bacterium]
QLIFDGGRTRAQIDAAEAAARGSLANWERTILLALEEVESAAVDLRAARARVALFAVALEAAENAAILARSQYETGLIDFETLLLTENQLLSARNSLASSAVERASAFVRLTQALGGGWDGAPADMNEGTPR